jgi:hypothetical protein
MPIGSRILAYRKGSSFTAQSLYTTQTPSAPSNNDSVTYEMGTKFTLDKNGQISAIRFYKASSETGTHIGKIWDASGSLLQSVTFTGETTSGWQQQSLSTPLTVQGGVIYLVSYGTNGYYPVSNGGLSTQRINGDISSVVGGLGGNGCFVVSAGNYPNSSFNASDYFVDIVYTPTTNTVSPVSPFKYFRSPASDNIDDGTTYEMGVKFSSRTAGIVTHIHYWKSSLDTSVTHTGRIWSSTGTELANVTFTGETASGWQTQQLSTPLTITANTVYTASVNCRYYGATSSELASDYIHSYITVPANGGVYGSVGTRPTNFFQGGNYFRDITFVPS